MHNWGGALKDIETIERFGKVLQVVGPLVEGYLPGAVVGDRCEILPENGRPSVQADVVGFRESRALMMPFQDVRGVGVGSEIRLTRDEASVPAGEELLGRVIDALGNPIDEQGALNPLKRIPLEKGPINPLKREPISEPLDVGIRVVNALMTIGKGMRMAIFSGSGVGKSIMLGMMAKFTKADVVVIALVGERGREVAEFLEMSLGQEGISKSVLVVATADETPILRVRAGFLATSIAEYFCSQGKDVLLLMDSLTRLAMAQREIGLSVGEPPTTKGYTPSVFSLLPRVMERAGNFKGEGSITGLYTVLVEGDDIAFDGISDAIRAVSDGHILLSRELAFQNIYPAVDVLRSVSRVMSRVSSKEHLELANNFRDMLANYQKAEDLINIGAYARGSNPKIDAAIAKHDKMLALVRQGENERVEMAKSLVQLKDLFR